MVHKAQHRRARKDALDRLSKLDQELGLRWTWKRWPNCAA
jgi:hypothetical protein